MHTPNSKMLSAFKLSLPLVISILLLEISIGKGQSVGISNVAITPDASSILEMRSTSKGLLLPRMTQAQRDAINGGTFATGLLIFNTDAGKFNFYDGISWRTLFSGSSVVNSVTGTTDRILISGTTSDPIINISPNYIGQSTITT